MDTPTNNDLQSRITELERTRDAVERRHAIDLALIEADAVDLESARLLTEVAVASMSDADAKAAVADLKKRKPFLFRSRTPSPTSSAASMSSAPARRADSAADHAASEAAARAGDRRALLRYLRARRGT